MLLNPKGNARLIIFTRYPEPGKVKTRLIPTLGALGAANLHRQMTESTLSQVRKIQNNSSISIEVRFTGGSLTLMQNWLGKDLSYQPQGEGDLGSRMARSLCSAFKANIDMAVIIGCDCPELNTEILTQAFQQLYSHNLVLGPATDGGYYLIGLRHFFSELFTNINWGTAEVLQQTINIARQLNLLINYLPQLTDIDRPEDLTVWENFKK